MVWILEVATKELSKLLALFAEFVLLAELVAEHEIPLEALLVILPVALTQSYALIFCP